MNEEEERYLTAKQAARMLGVHPITLYRWAKEGKIKYVRTPTGRLRYPLSEIERLRSTYRGKDNVVIYARVSDRKFVESGFLDRQVDFLRDYARKKGYNVVEIIKDVALIGKRSINRLFNLAITGRIGKILLVGLDRLAPIFSDLFKDIFKTLGVEIEIAYLSDPDLEIDRKIGLIDILTTYLRKGKI